jgi:hypothetical protein
MFLDLGGIVTRNRASSLDTSSYLKEKRSDIEMGGEEVARIAGERVYGCVVLFNTGRKKANETLLAKD